MVPGGAVWNDAACTEVPRVRELSERNFQPAAARCTTRRCVRATHAARFHVTWRGRGVGSARLSTFTVIDCAAVSAPGTTVAARVCARAREIDTAGAP